MDDIKRNLQERPRQPFVLAPSPASPPENPMRESVLSPPKRRSFWRGTVFILGAALLLLLMALGFLFYQGLSLGGRMQFDNGSTRSFLTELKRFSGALIGTNHVALKGEADGRINILLLGRAGETYPGRNLTDTVMIASIAPDTKQVALLSLPRDLYVPIGRTALYTKLNSVYQYGLSRDEGVAPLRETIETITGEPVHYFATLDFDGFERVVDTLGGISVDVPRDFTDTRYPGKHYSYETFQIKKGWQTLDGATALKYVRERHADPEGDFGRAKRQQQVLQAIKTKALSLGTLWNIATVNRLIDTLGDSVKTDMAIDDMARFLELVRTIDTRNVTTVVVDAWKPGSLLRTAHVQVGDVAAFILVPRVGNWSEIRDLSENIFSRDSTQKRKALIEGEQPTLILYSRSADRTAAARMAAFVRDELGFTTVSLAPLPPLDKPLEESIIGVAAPEGKPYSLDELLKRFSLKQASDVSFPPVRGQESDFAIIMGEDLSDVFSLAETAIDEGADDNAFSEPLPPQPLPNPY